jgi:nucleosome binding factor SPN SPT16 subunit
LSETRISDIFNATRGFIAKFLHQIKEGNPPVPVEILVQAKAKEPPSDALPKFVEAYTSFKRVGSLVKEACTGKLMTEWEQGVSKADKKPELVDMAPALSAFMAVKDEEEMVCPRIASGSQWPSNAQRRNASVRRQILLPLCLFTTLF